MAQKTRISGRSTAAVLWLMILLVFLPIAIGHVVARQTADAPARGGALQQAPPAAG